LQQSHFLESGENSDNRLWPIPLFSNHQSFPKLMNQKVLKHTLADNQPILLNVGGLGHYIVNYLNSETQSYLSDQIKNQNLSHSDRIMLLSNSAMLTRAGHQSFNSVLELLKAYGIETDEAVWNIIAVVI